MSTDGNEAGFLPDHPGDEAARDICGFFENASEMFTRSRFLVIFGKVYLFRIEQCFEVDGLY